MPNFKVNGESRSYAPVERGGQYLKFDACFSLIGQTVLEI